MSALPPTGLPAQFNEDELLVGDVYAAALLEAAEEKGEAEVEDAAAGLADLVGYMGKDRDFELFMTADSVDDEPRRVSLEKLFRGRMSDLVLNLLQVLNNRGRMGLLRAVARCVQVRMEARHREREITVRTAAPLTDALRERIRRVVGEYVGRHALLIEQIDPELIGGIVLQIGDVRVDGSVAAKLRTVRKRLGERAIAEVHRGGGYVLEA